MPSLFACATIFFHAHRDDLVARYEALAEPADGYLTSLRDTFILVDAVAAATADWGRQVRLGLVMSGDGVFALTVVLLGEYWALALAQDEQPGPAAVCVPNEPDMLSQLPRQLFDIERVLVESFPFAADADKIDAIFGAMLDGAQPIDEAFTELLEMLGCPNEWMRWSWDETIPQQLFIDPDLVARVTPLGDASGFWEE